MYCIRPNLCDAADVGPPVNCSMMIINYTDMLMNPSVTVVVCTKISETFKSGGLPMLAIEGIPTFVKL